MSAPVSLIISDIRKEFKKVLALDGITLDFSSGMMHGVIGPEGAGKTTLMRIILGLLKVKSGTVQFMRGGEAIDFEQIRPSLAYVPQSQSLYPDLSVAEHLDFFKALYGISDDLYQKRKKELLHICRLTDFVDRPAGELSGGMYKKLALMCALLRSPEVMLLDEPTSGVDPISRRELWELFYRLLDQKILIIVTTSYMDEAERCNRVHLLEQGKLIASGEPRQLLLENKVRSFDELFLKRVAHA